MCVALDIFYFVYPDSFRISVLAEIIKELLPRILDYTSTYGDELVNSLNQEAVRDLVLTEGFLTLLSALLKRTSPTNNISSESGHSHSDISTISGHASTYQLVGAEEDGTKTSSFRERERQSVLVHSESWAKEEKKDVQNSDPSHEYLFEKSDLTSHTIATFQQKMGSLCIFALIWSFSAYISSSK